MDNTLNYLKEIFGMNIEYDKFYDDFPMYMMERYHFHFIKIPIEDKSYVLVKARKKQGKMVNHDI